MVVGFLIFCGCIGLGFECDPWAGRLAGSWKSDYVVVQVRSLIWAFVGVWLWLWFWIMLDCDGFFLSFFA